MFVPRYTEQELREVVAGATSLSQVLRHFGLRPAGGNHRLLRGWLEKWNISTDALHAGMGAAAARAHAARRDPRRGLDVQPRPSQAPSLRRGCKERRLRALRPGRGMARRQHGADPRSRQRRGRTTTGIENLRIVCPNCAATLETHCGRQNRVPGEERVCLHCGEAFRTRHSRQRYCSRPCARSCTEVGLAAGAAAGGAAVLRAVGRGGGRDELERGRAQVRRQRHRGAQMGAGVRARTCRLGGLTDARQAKHSSRRVSISSKTA